MSSIRDIAILFAAAFLVVGVLIALLLPDIGSPREATPRNHSLSNLREIMIALHNYNDTFGHLPPRASLDDQDNPQLSWRVHLLPFLEEVQLYKQFHLDEPWGSDHNKKLIDKMPDVYNAPGFDEPGKTLYQVVVGAGTVFEGDQPMNWKDIADDHGNTIMVLEVDPDRGVIWTKPDDFHYDPSAPTKGLGKARPGNIFLAAMADGHAFALSKDIEPDALRALFTANGGEKIDPAALGP